MNVNPGGRLGDLTGEFGISAEIGPPSTRRWDVRLVPAAGLGWLIAWPAPLLPAGVLTVVAASALIAAAFVLALHRQTRAGRPAASRDRGAAALALALAGLAMVAATSAAHVHARDASPLHQPALRGHDVRLQLQITEAVRSIAPAAAGSRVVVAARMLSGTCVGSCEDAAIRSWTSSGDVLVFAPALGWSELTPGSTVTAVVGIAAAAPEDLIVAIAFARAPPEKIRPPAGVLGAAAAGIRSGLRDRAQATLGLEQAGLLRGIVLGDTAGMDAILVEDFRVSGLSHLTAVSGTNCAIVVGAILWPLRRSRLRALTRALIAALALAAFVVLVGPQPSVLRAAAMGAITLLALATGRLRQAVPALAAAVLVLLSVDPGLARDLGFALSVAATTGIVCLAGSWTEWLKAHGWPPPLAVATSVCAAAGLFTAPLLVLIVARVSLISLPANLLVVPVVAVVTVLGLAAALVSPLWPWLAELILRLVDWPLRWMVWIAERAARTPGASLPWPEGFGGALALTAAIVGSVLLLRRRRIRWLVAAACVGIVAGGLTLRVLAPSWPPPGWTLVACDVGQGDALVVSLADARAIVIDAGPDPVLVDGCLRRLGVQQVPMIVLSHLHADHVDGLVGILRGRTVGAIATSDDPPAAEVYDRIGRTAEEAGVPMVTLAVGEVLVADDSTIEVLGPVARYGGTRSDPNNSSVVARISVGELSVLGTGDIEVEAQGDLLRRGTDLTADVLKVAHHGSAAQDPRFASATQAGVALISVGAGNDYGHPDELLVNRLLAAGMTVHRTDQDGDIAVLGKPGAGLTVVGRGDPIPARADASADLPAGERPSGQRPTERQRLGALPRGPGSGRTPACSHPNATGSTIQHFNSELNGPPGSRRRRAPRRGRGSAQRPDLQPGSRRPVDVPDPPTG